MDRSKKHLYARDCVDEFVAFPAPRGVQVRTLCDVENLYRVKKIEVYVINPIVIPEGWYVYRVQPDGTLVN